MSRCVSRDPQHYPQKLNPLVTSDPFRDLTPKTVSTVNRQLWPTRRAEALLHRADGKTGVDGACASLFVSDREYPATVRRRTQLVLGLVIDIVTSRDAYCRDKVLALIGGVGDEDIQVRRCIRNRILSPGSPGREENTGVLAILGIRISSRAVRPATRCTHQTWLLGIDIQVANA